ncbi:PAS domain S-box-containing protein [Dethiosulfatibacter aminovorans DSM 17477]|uniref:PAS domain S-box-containing protein n=1 Tax=Dethiosulfatibacter aminovorans DSM 17477 TaxID=1121476 RepID=A0A1M6AVJ5_9FIRM|nr:sigma 54-interacting transcriptional regulator [Dethiosulfatibacter aminovorans]SHI40467.1 PAS domain S-box-containing protein [Dethiosulfatibacter aminovorans DSM 17477]
MNEDCRYKYIFDQILRMTDDGFIVVNKDGVVTDINDQYCDFLGIDKKKAIGGSIKNIISNSKMIDIVKNRYDEEGVIHKFVEGETKDKDNDFLLVSRSCVLDENKDVVAGVAQVKFRFDTLNSAKKLMKEYMELEFFKEEYNRINSERFCFDEIVGRNRQFLDMKKKAFKASRNTFPVLITGESGTGKEVFARAIHYNSDRKDKPMVGINCGAIPSELLESELFGYEEGSFSGAKRGGKDGKFIQAEGGTVFLDEIGDMPLNMQVKILRVLQENEVDKIGGKEPIPIDVRVIAATKRNLVEMVKEGSFREDLFYRLNVINIEMVPLRDRREDINLFSNYFLSRLNDEYKSFVTFSGEAKTCLQNYSWPGNIRELNNVIKSAYATCDEFVIQLTDLPSKLVTRHNVDKLICSDNKLLKCMMEEYESSVIKEYLKNSNYNCMEAAEKLGIHRSLLYKKINKYGIKMEK